VLKLTVRQNEVASLVVKGKTNEQIASDLGISTARVKQLVAIVARKLPGHGPSRCRIIAAISIQQLLAA
jgi:DNA-binding CsgD family transcriptional regulator